MGKIICTLLASLGLCNVNTYARNADEFSKNANNQTNIFAATERRAHGAARGNERGGAAAAPPSGEQKSTHRTTRRAQAINHAAKSISAVQSAAQYASFRGVAFLPIS
jgi:hypothetical protein